MKIRRIPRCIPEAAQTRFPFEWIHIRGEAGKRIGLGIAWNRRAFGWYVDKPRVLDAVAE